VYTGPTQPQNKPTQATVELCVCVCVRGVCVYVCSVYTGPTQPQNKQMKAAVELQRTDVDALYWPSFVPRDPALRRDFDLLKRFVVAVCCSVLQCVAVSCSVLQYVSCVVVCVPPYWSSFGRAIRPFVAILICSNASYCSVLQCSAVCCSVLQCAAVCCSVLLCVAVCCSVI